MDKVTKDKYVVLLFCCLKMNPKHSYQHKEQVVWSPWKRSCWFYLGITAAIRVGCHCLLYTFTTGCCWVWHSGPLIRDNLQVKRSNKLLLTEERGCWWLFDPLGCSFKETNWASPPAPGTGFLWPNSCVSSTRLHLWHRRGRRSEVELCDLRVWPQRRCRRPSGF